LDKNAKTIENHKIDQLLHSNAQLFSGVFTPSLRASLYLQHFQHPLFSFTKSFIIHLFPIINPKIFRLKNSNSLFLKPLARTESKNSLILFKHSIAKKPHRNSYFSTPYICNLFKIKNLS